MSLRPTCIEYSPFDLRVCLRILLVYLGWKLLSLDYSSLAATVGGPAACGLPSSLELLAGVKTVLLGTTVRILSLQLGGAIMLLAAAVRLQRPLVAAGLAPVLVLEWAAYSLRGELYEFALPVSLLLICLAWPGSWKRVLAGDTRCTPAATALGRALALYMGLAYFLCGYSKLATGGWLWWQSLHLELLLPAMAVWHSTVLPEPLQTTAEFCHRLFTAYPLLGEIGALVTLVAELTWITSLVSRYARRVIPYVMFATHVGILLGSGINFLSMAVIALSLVIPWRLVLVRRSREGPLAPCDDSRQCSPAGVVRPSWQGAAARYGLAGIAALAAVLPSVGQNHYVPLANYNQFGWSYAGVAQEATIYRVGYLNRDRDRIELVPMNYGGYMDFRWIALSGQYAERCLKAATEAEKIEALRILEQCRRSLRPHASNAAILGPAAMPAHVLAESEPIPAACFDRLHIMRGQVRFPDGELTIHWEPLGELPQPGGVALGPLTRPASESRFAELPLRRGSADR